MIRVTSLFAALMLAACGPRGESRALGGYRGASLPRPYAKPTFTFTRAEGTPFDFVRETEGKVALLFFGYTHCPDVCPIHLTNIAAILQRMTFSERNQVVVVFVTTDPSRDTAERLRSWLGAIDPMFVGLRASEDEVRRLQYSLDMPVAERQAGPDSSKYLVGHASQVLAFSKDGFARYAYPFGIRQEDWAHDLPLLLGEQIAADSTERTRTASVDPARVLSGETRVVRAVMAAPLTETEGAVYVTLYNGRSVADTLTSVETALAARVVFHDTRDGKMGSIPAVAIPPLGVADLSPGGVHVMLLGMTRRPRAGDTVDVTLVLAHAGRISARVPVVAYTQLDSVFTR